jgi:probable addiction module antidote protein
MGKAKTSRKRAFSFSDMPTTRLTKRAHAAVYDTKERLRDPKFVVQALTEALVDGDAEAFKEILAGHLAAVEKESFYREAGVSRRTLFRMLGPGGNPTLANIARVVKAIANEAA